MKSSKIIVTLVLGLFAGVLIALVGIMRSKEIIILKPLSIQEKSEGIRGIYDIDKKINEATIDNYLDRSDIVYRDVRMLEDTAAWENAEGERYLTGFVKGFEIIPYAYLANFTESYIKEKADENVSNLYSGKTLFKLDEDGNYVANYKESMPILEYIFPKDKTIFLMSGNGSYANLTKQMLVALGWDRSKIYNVGGFWNYDGKNTVSTKVDGKDKCDFSKVAYHAIDFDRLTPVK